MKVIREDNLNEDLKDEVQKYYNDNLSSKYGDVKFGYSNYSRYGRVVNCDYGYKSNEIYGKQICRDLTKAGYRISTYKNKPSSDKYGRFIGSIIVRKDDRLSDFKQMIDNMPLDRILEIIVGDYSISIPKFTTKEDLEDYISKDALNWLLSHTPLHQEYSRDRIVVIFRASPEFNKLRGMEYTGARKRSLYDIDMDTFNLQALNDRDSNESLDEDTKKEWKPNLNYKHIKDVLDNALSRGKYINNEREEVKAALDLCDKKQKYTPEQRKFIQDSHREMWKKNRKTNEDLLPDEVFDDVVKHGKWTYVVGLYSSIKHPPEYTYHYEINTEKGVYTKVPNGYGFIAHWLLQSYPQDSMEEMEEEAQSLIKKYGCKEVPFEEYKEMIDGKKSESLKKQAGAQRKANGFHESMPVKKINGRDSGTFEDDNYNKKLAKLYLQYLDDRAKGWGWDITYTSNYNPETRCIEVYEKGDGHKDFLSMEVPPVFAEKTLKKMGYITDEVEENLTVQEDKEAFEKEFGK